MLNLFRSFIEKLLVGKEDQIPSIVTSPEMKTIEEEFQKIQSSIFTKTSPETVEAIFDDFVKKGQLPGLNEEFSTAVKSLLEFNPSAVSALLSMVQPIIQKTTHINSQNAQTTLRSAAEQSFLL